MSNRNDSATDPYARGMMSAKTNEWNTPPEILKLAYLFSDFDVDPCSNKDSIVKSRRRFMLPEQDGLDLPWRDHPLRTIAWVNPPYAGAVGSWLVKGIAEWKHHRVESIFLLPASTGLDWFQSFAVRATAMCFLAGRVSFLSPGKKRNSAFFPSVMLYFGYKSQIPRFKEAFGEAGWIVIP